MPTVSRSRSDQYPWGCFIYTWGLAVTQCCFTGHCLFDEGDTDNIETNRKQLWSKPQNSHLMGILEFRYRFLHVCYPGFLSLCAFLLDETCLCCRSNNYLFCGIFSPGCVLCVPDQGKQMPQAKNFPEEFFFSPCSCSSARGCKAPGWLWASCEIRPRCCKHQQPDTEWSSYFWNISVSVRYSVVWAETGGLTSTNCCYSFKNQIHL